MRVSGSKTSLMWRGRSDGFAFGRGISDLAGVGNIFHAELGIAEERDELLADLFGRVAGEDAAVHVGLRGLRQRVVGVACGEARGNAGGAEVGVEAWLGAEASGRGSIGRRGQDGADVVSRLARFPAWRGCSK